LATVPLKVTLLTLHDCHLCEHARDVLARLGRERPIVIDETAWDSAEGQRLVQRDGIPFAPAVYIDGSFAAYGRISDGALRRWLSKREPRRWLPWRRLS
jgi:glutaredoxin